MILVDTGPLVALCDARDTRHAAAVVHLASLARSGLRVCEPVLAETCFHLPHRMQRERLRAMLDEFRMEPVTTHDAALRAEILTWLIKYADHEPDWADGCLAVLSGRDTRHKVWTYDREFRTTWRRPDGKAIPMAVRL